MDQLLAGKIARGNFFFFSRKTQSLRFWKKDANLCLLHSCQRENERVIYFLSVCKICSVSFRQSLHFSRNVFYANCAELQPFVLLLGLLGIKHIGLSYNQHGVFVSFLLFLNSRTVLCSPPPVLCFSEGTNGCFVQKHFAQI